MDGLQAVRLKTVIGGDYPLGDEAERRITFGVRMDAAQVRYLTVIEPFEKENSVQSVFAPSADRLIVTLKDGREQRFYFSGMEEEGGVPAVKMEKECGVHHELRINKIKRIVNCVSSEFHGGINAHHLWNVSTIFLESLKYT